MLSVVRMFVQKTSERIEKKIRSLSKRTTESERENSMQKV